MKRFMIMIVAILGLSCSVVFAQPDKETCSIIDINDIRETVDLLAHPAFGGRGTGQDGFDAAGIFLARELRLAGFRTFTEGSDSLDGYFHNFSFEQEKVDVDGSQMRIGQHERRSLEYGDDYLPMFLGFENASAYGSVVFVGYGITAPEYDYDDYADMDVDGQNVIVLRHEPREESATDDFFDGAEMTSHALFTSKVRNALEHGAVGVIFVEDVLNHPDSTVPIDLLSKPTGRMVSIGTNRPMVEPEELSSGISIVSVSVVIADELLGSSSEQLQMELDNTGMPGSFVRNDVWVSMTTASSTVTHHSRNVVGYIPGTSNEWLIIGAHYDHMGTQEDGVFLGADDNASGTAGALAVAKALAKPFRDNGRVSRRHIVVGFWGAEEWGLQGSWRFAQSELVPVDQRIAYLNMDMIGRNTPNEISLMGAETNADFPRVSTYLSEMVDRVNQNMAWPLELSLEKDGFFLRTDSASFFLSSPEDRRLPILAFSSGLHDDYHKPTDDASKVNAQKIKQVACLVYGMADAMSRSDVRPEYVPIEAEKQ